MNTGSGSSGWVLVCVMIFILVLQASAVGIAALVTYGTRATSAFCNITRELYAKPLPDSSVAYNRLRLGAPEGWSHRYFLTLLEVRYSRCISGCSNIKIKSAYWKVGLLSEPYREIRDVWLAGWATDLIILIDDSESMHWSCGADYDPSAVYEKRKTGDIIKTSLDIDIDTDGFVKSGSLIYFKGEYGNSHFLAPLSKYFTGAMPRWTLAFSYLEDIAGSLDMVQVAVATTSRGIILPFTNDMNQVAATIDSIHPCGPTSPLAKALFSLGAKFGDKCVQNRCVLIVTDGDALHDGNLPDGIKDFDMDSDPMDRYVEGMGSRCLDDVASYLESMDVRVHVKGFCHDSTFLRQVAQEGGGIYSPAGQDLVPKCSFITQMPVLFNHEELGLENSKVVFCPRWLSTGGAVFYDLEKDKQTIERIAIPGFRGVLLDTCVDGSTLYCSTSKDYLLSIDLKAKALKWVIHGLGGEIRARDGKIVVGPDRDSLVYVIDIDNGLNVLWKASCNLALLTPVGVYTVDGADIAKRNMNTGEVNTLFSASMEFSSLEYDPLYGFIIAGTKSGDFYVLDSELDLQYILSTYSNAPGLDADVFTHRKRPYFVLVTGEGVSVSTPDSLVWSRSLEGFSYTGAVVMDSKIYLSTWQRPGTCPGIDTGKSYLHVLDALTGKQLESVILFKGLAFGPVIDLAGAQLHYVNWNNNRVSIDISGLHGIDYSGLGRILEHG